MLHSPLLIPPSADFWREVALALIENPALAASGAAKPQDLSMLRVVVPGFAHAQQLRTALAAQLQCAFLPPRITTLPAWLAMLPPDGDDDVGTSQGERLMSLYAELRQHGWLKKLFTARRNTDLLPLAQTLLTLFDELSRALLPAMRLAPDAAETRWQSALEQLPVPARSMLSDEAQLVWSLWKSQLDANDPTAICFAQMMRIANAADAPLIWIDSIEPDALDQAFLNAYAAREDVWMVLPDWRAGAVDAAYAAAWPEAMASTDSSEPDIDMPVARPAGLSLYPARSLEDEAQRGAQTVIDWLQSGKTSVAIVAQDRVVARRIRALLERAQVMVTDETGWKLSTTRSAASIAALLDAVTTRGETIALLDLLKSPFLFADLPDKSERVMAIEHALRRFNVLGGWEAAMSALRDTPPAREALEQIAHQAALFVGRKTLAEWGAMTSRALDALGMRATLDDDAAGTQVIALLDMLMQDCSATSHPFSFAEWRAFLGLQLESTPFVPPVADRRVAMLQLNGALLRSFDAVLMVGADADHLPSQSTETLFFANGVRRELGLETRESRQRTQLRDFIEMLSANPQVVLSWQSHKNGEPNAVSTWIERLQLALEHACAGTLPLHHAEIDARRLIPAPPSMPAPSAPQLTPQKLSASGYNSLVACPYQFFATRMLGLNGLDELSDMPEKRDYGDWLHEILKLYHEALRDHRIDLADRQSLLLQISEDIFRGTLAHSAAALGYYARWQKVIPAYLEWANQREADGWKFVLGEQRFEKVLHWADGRIALHGCVDRIDENDAGERAVLDYKTRNAQALRDKLKDGEDHQLAFYGLLSDVPVAAGHLVALEVARGKTGDVEAGNYSEWQRLLEAQIVASVGAIAQGAPLPATGIERVCVYCEVRGLCRKGAW
jgi:ATP-dependent helicase/nuclease subunit B